MKKIAQKALETFSTRRMEALTDGVFAIAMTLLILDIKVEDFGTVTNSAQLAAALYDHSTVLISFVISFLLLGSMWAVHMRQFEYITQTDRHLTMINTWRLLIVVFMPLTTSIGGAYQGIELARVLLPFNFFLLSAVSTWEWRYAANNEYLSEKIPPAIKQDAWRRNIIILVTAGLVSVLSFFVGQLAFLLFAVLPFVAIPGERNKHTSRS